MFFSQLGQSVAGHIGASTITSHAYPMARWPLAAGPLVANVPARTHAQVHVSHMSHSRSLMPEISGIVSPPLHVGSLPSAPTLHLHTSRPVL